MATLKDLLTQRAALEQQIAETTARERAEAVSNVKALMDTFGLTVADLSVRGSKGLKEAKPSKVAPKYRDKASGQTWSGRGLQPKWLKAAISSGARLQDFAI